MPSPLAEVSADRSTRTHKTMSLVLKRAQTTANRRIAADLDIEESTLSRWRDDHLPRAVEYLLAIGCKVVPAELKCYDESYIALLNYFAQIGMRHAVDAPRALEWDE